VERNKKKRKAGNQGLCLNRATLYECTALREKTERYPTQKNVILKKPLSIRVSVLPGWNQEFNIFPEYLGSLCRRSVHFSTQLSSEQVISNETVFRIFSVVGMSSKPEKKRS